jgi:excisionase family DNA binding protein
MADQKTEDFLRGMFERRKAAKRAPPAPPPRLMTSGELAEALRVHPGTVRKLHREGSIKGMRFGPRTIRFDFQTVLQDLRLYTGGK